jgi:hypothetical protein
MPSHVFTCNGSSPRSTGDFMAKIVVIGSLNMDIVAVATRLPVAGETILGVQYLNEPGGKGANQAYAAAKALWRWRVRRAHPSSKRADLRPVPRRSR